MSKPTASRTAAAIRRPRWYAVGIALAAVAALVAVLVGTTRDGDDNDTAAAAKPALTLEMMDGETRSIGDYRGRPLVVNFFASWCVPCLAEMPGFEQVHQELKGDVAFLGVNLQDARQDGQRVVEETGVTYDIARDPDGSLFRAFEAFAMPTTVFIDARGSVVDLHSGEIRSGALADKIYDLLLT